MLDQVQSQAVEWVVDAAGVKVGERVDLGSDRGSVGQLVTQLLRQGVDHRVELTDELDPNRAQRGASVMPQGNLVSELVWRGGLGLLERVGQGVVGVRLDRHPMSVESIALVFVPAALPQGRLVWGNVTDIDSAADEELRQRPAEPAGTFDPDSIHGPQPARPLEHGRMPTAAVGEVAMFDMASGLVQRRSGEDLAMRVDTDGDEVCHTRLFS